MLSFHAKPRDVELPAVDDRLVAAGSGYEIFDGVLVAVPPAHEPHATYHSAVDGLLRAHVDDAFTVACDMLTRTSETSDVAPDLSVYPRARNPETGGRQLEQLAFQIMAAESMAHGRRRAAMLVERGVRRVFAIDLEPVLRALEWSAPLADWAELDPQASIYDPALAVPIQITALLDTVKADEAVAHALLRRRHHVIEAARAQDRAEGRAAGRAEGVLRGKAEAVVAVLSARGIALDSADRERILDERRRATPRPLGRPSCIVRHGLRVARAALSAA